MISAAAAAAVAAAIDRTANSLKVILSLLVQSLAPFHQTHNHCCTRSSYRRSYPSTRYTHIHTLLKQLLSEKKAKSAGERDQTPESGRRCCLCRRRRLGRGRQTVTRPGAVSVDVL